MGWETERETFACCCGRGWSDVNAQGLRKCGFSGVWEKRNFFFFFLMKYNLVHNVLNYQHLTLCVASSTLNIISFCSLA